MIKLLNEASGKQLTEGKDIFKKFKKGEIDTAKYIEDYKR